VSALAGQGRWLPVIVVAIGALPAAALAAHLLAATRARAGLPAADAWRRSLTEVGMIIGTTPWLWMILTPLPDDPLLHLIPFEDLYGQFQRPLLWILFQVGGNLLVFAAYGFLAPIRWPIRPLWVVVTAGAASVTVEVLQWALHLGRVTSVDDVLLNAAGAGLAALASRRWWAPRG
jgi:VanZ like family